MTSAAQLPPASVSIGSASHACLLATCEIEKAKTEIGTSKQRFREESVNFNARFPSALYPGLGKVLQSTQAVMHAQQAHIDALNSLVNGQTRLMSGHRQLAQEQGREICNLRTTCDAKERALMAALRTTHELRLSLHAKACEQKQMASALSEARKALLPFQLRPQPPTLPVQHPPQQILAPKPVRPQVQPRPLFMANVN